MPRVTITVPEKNAQPYRFKLDRQVVTFGRGSDNDIIIDCGSVSAKHAEMRRIEGGYELIDIGSTNGIKFNGVRQQVISLHDGASVRLGDVAFDFSLTDEESEALARETAPAKVPSNPAPESRLQERILQQRAQLTAPPSKAINFAGILVFLFLAAFAFCAGLAVRYQKDTGASLFKAMQANFTVRKVITVPRPVPETEQAPAALPAAK